MKKIFLINAQKAFGESEGKLNITLQNKAKEVLTQLGYDIKETVIDNGYDISSEAEKYMWADIIIYQMPAWWMAPPWIMKKYLDEVLGATYGHLFSGDGRSRKDSNKKYGSGGLAKDKKYMLSVTWNAPLEAFEDPDQFFEGKGVDAVYFPFHKANQFLGMTPLPTFMCNDVVKAPDIPNDLIRYQQHLNSLFSL